MNPSRHPANCVGADQHLSWLLAAAQVAALGFISFGVGTAPKGLPWMDPGSVVLYQADFKIGHLYFLFSSIVPVDNLSKPKITAWVI